MEANTRDNRSNSRSISCVSSHSRANSRVFSRDSTQHIDAVHEADKTKLYNLNELNIKATRPMVITLFVVVGIYCIIGVASYHNVDGWSDLDSIYFSVVTLATIGYGDYAPKNDSEKIFTCFFVLIGISICVCFLAFFRILVEARTTKEDRLKSLKTMYMIEENLLKTRTLTARDHNHMNALSLRNDSHSSVDASMNNVPTSFYNQMKTRFQGLRSSLWEYSHGKIAAVEPSSDESLNTIRAVHKKTYEDDVIRAYKKMFLNFIFIFIIVFFGAIAMSSIESWSGIDAAYFAVITICTIGYGDVVPTTNSGKVFTIFYILLGCGFMAKAIQDLATAPAELRVKHNEIEVLNQFTGNLSRQKLDAIFNSELNAHIIRLKRADQELSKSEFVLLLLYMMNKIDGKDIYIASQIFEHLDKDSKGYLSTQDMADTIRSAVDEPAKDTPRTIRQRFNNAVQNVEHWTKNASPEYRRSTSLDGHDNTLRHNHVFHPYHLSAAIKTPTARQPSTRAGDESPDLSTIHVRRSSAFKSSSTATDSNPVSKASGSDTSPRATSKRQPSELSQPLIDPHEV